MNITYRGKGLRPASMSDDYTQDFCRDLLGIGWRQAWLLAKWSSSIHISSFRYQLHTTSWHTTFSIQSDSLFKNSSLFFKLSHICCLKERMFLKTDQYFFLQSSVGSLFLCILELAYDCGLGWEDASGQELEWESGKQEENSRWWKINVTNDFNMNLTILSIMHSYQFWKDKALYRSVLLLVSLLMSRGLSNK